MLHPAEIDHFTSLPASGLLRSQYLASRWAVKESFIKAFGDRVQFPDLHVHRVPPDPRAKLSFSGSALQAINSAGIGEAHISLSHEQEFAIAFVVLEKRAQKPGQEAK